MALTVDNYVNSLSVKYALTSLLDGMGGYNFVILDRETGKIKKYVASITPDGRLQRPYNIGKEFADAVGIQLDSKGRIKMVRRTRL